MLYLVNRFGVFFLHCLQWCYFLGLCRFWMIMFSFAFFCNLVRVFRHVASSSAGLLPCPSVFAPLFSYLFFYFLVYVCFSFLAFPAPSFHKFFFLRFNGSLKGLVGLLTLRLPSLGCVFLTSSLRLRFSFFTLDLYLQFIWLFATQGLASYSCFPTQSFGIPWKTSLPSSQQVSAV